MAQKSSGESGQQEQSDLPAKLSKPAWRALTGAGYWQLEQLTTVSATELLKLHGMGPKALDQLRAALAERGLALAGE
jgi:DNA-directed RNA polymerase alpha subunit